MKFEVFGHIDQAYGQDLWAYQNSMPSQVSTCSLFTIDLQTFVQNHHGTRLPVAWVATDAPALQCHDCVEG